MFHIYKTVKKNKNWGSLETKNIILDHDMLKNGSNHGESNVECREMLNRHILGLYI